MTVIAFQALGVGAPALQKYTPALGWQVGPVPPRLIYSMAMPTPNDLYLAATGSGEAQKLYHMDVGTGIFTEQTLPGSASSSSYIGIVRYHQGDLWYLGLGNGTRGFWHSNTPGVWTLITNHFFLNSVREVVPVAGGCWLVGASGGAGAGKVGVAWCTSTPGITIEDEGNGLNKFDPEIGNNQTFNGAAYDPSNGNLVLVDGGTGGIGSKIYTGLLGGWTKLARLDATYGYGSTYNAGGAGRHAHIDANGKLFVTVNQQGVDPCVVLSGDPNAAQPSLAFEVDSASLNLGIGDNWSANGFVLLHDNDKGLFYIPGTGWTVPAIPVGSYYGQALSSEPQPPNIENESPAPSSSENAPDVTIEFDVVDQDGDALASATKVWINETLAWFNEQPLIGWSGTVVPIAGGFRYVITPDDSMPLADGLNTVRAYVKDASGLDAEYSWSFSVTVPEDVTPADDDPQDDITAGIDLKLSTSHDLVIEAYDLALVAGVDEVAQHLLVALRLFYGEWYLDSEAGMPYYSRVFISNPSSRTVEAIFRQTILGDTDIERIKSFAMEINRRTRKLDVAFEAVSKLGVVSIDDIFPR